MNFIAHAHVAVTLGASPDVVFGAILPDLASMAAVPLSEAPLPAAVLDGIRLHYATDRVFHGLEPFRSGSRHLSGRLEASGLPRGASRAVGHAGWELLLDGCLLERPGVAASFGEMLAQAPDVAPAVSPRAPDRWRSLFDSLRDQQWWRGYEDPAVVSQRLWRRLRDRPRLAIPAGDLAVVTAALRSERLGVDAVTEQVIEAVSSAVG